MVLYGAGGSQASSSNLEKTALRGEQGMFQKLMDDDEVPQGNADQAAIHALIAALSDKDGRVRQRARWALIDIGEPAVAPLIEALADKRERVRWQAAKALSKIGSPAAGPALVRALEDKRFGVRWLAAEGLIALRREGLVSLLEALVSRSDSAWLREGAHHVLHTLAEEGLRADVSPVLAALEDVEPAVECPGAAKTVLNKLRDSFD
jgi:HEAT repeat protein